MIRRDETRRAITISLASYLKRAKKSLVQVSEFAEEKFFQPLEQSIGLLFKFVALFALHAAAAAAVVVNRSSRRHREQDRC